MTPAQLTKLKSEVQTDPLALGFAAMLPNSPGKIVTTLNTVAYTMAKTRNVSAKTIFSECVGAVFIWDALNTAAATNSSVKMIINFLNQDTGIDFGHVAISALIDLLVPAVLTTAQANSLKNLAVMPASRAEVLGLGTVVESDLHAAGVN